MFPAALPAPPQMAALPPIPAVPVQQGQLQYGRVYQLQQAAAPQAPPAIEGMFPIHGTMGRVLFDTGATHCFIATHFAKALGLLATAENTVTCVDSPLGSGSLIFFICRGVGVEIGSLVLPTDMMVLDMNVHDVIIGMDWLADYRAMIDCFGGSIVFAILGQVMFVVAMPRPEGGSTAHLYYLEEDTSKEVVIPLDSIPVVMEYSDMFQEIQAYPPGET